MGDEIKKMDGGKLAILILRVFELIFCIVCLGCVDAPGLAFYIDQREIHLCYVTFCVVLIWCVIFFIVLLVGTPSSWQEAACWTCIGFVLFLATSVCLCLDWDNVRGWKLGGTRGQNIDLLGATALCALINTILLLVDFILLIVFGTKGKLGLLLIFVVMGVMCQAYFLNWNKSYLIANDQKLREPIAKLSKEQESMFIFYKALSLLNIKLLEWRKRFFQTSRFQLSSEGFPFNTASMELL